MKKIISLALAMILAFALAIPAFATTDVIGSGTVNTDPEDGTVSWTDRQGSSTATYTMAGSYTVSIPATINVATGTGATNTVTVTDAMLGYNQQLVIKAYCSAALTLVGSNSAVTIAYSIKYDTDKTLSTNSGSPSEILTVAGNGNSGFIGFADTPVTLTAIANEAAPYAGLYTDTVTFTTSVVDVTP